MQITYPLFAGEFRLKDPEHIAHLKSDDFQERLAALETKVQDHTAPDVIVEYAPTKWYEDGIMLDITDTFTVFKRHSDGTEQEIARESNTSATSVTTSQLLYNRNLFRAVSDKIPFTAQ
jgi:hypothetical protein